MAGAVDIKIRDQVPITVLRIAQVVRTIPAAEPDADIAARQREQRSVEQELGVERAVAEAARRQGARPGGRLERAVIATVALAIDDRRARHPVVAQFDREFGRDAETPRGRDRKSAGYGKSGSVRVDLGGRRII